MDYGQLLRDNPLRVGRAALFVAANGGKFRAVVVGHKCYVTPIARRVVAIAFSDRVPLMRLPPEGICCCLPSLRRHVTPAIRTEIVTTGVLRSSCEGTVLPIGETGY